MYVRPEITAPPRQSSNLERMLLGSSFLHTQYTFDTEILLLRLNSKLYVEHRDLIVIRFILTCSKQQ